MQTQERTKNPNWRKELEDDPTIAIFNFGAVPGPPSGYAVVATDHGEGGWFFTNEYGDESCTHWDPWTARRWAWEHYRFHSGDHYARPGQTVDGLISETAKL